MLIKNTKAFTIAILVLFVSGCSPKMIFTSSWQGSPITVDGKATEWDIPLRLVDHDTHLNYEVRNDDSNVYFCIRVFDLKTQTAITGNGLSIWIDTTGKRMEKTGIMFPVMENTTTGAADGSKGDAEKSQSKIVASDSAGIDNLRNHVGDLAKEIRYSNLKNIPFGMMGLPGDYGIRAALGWDKSGAMIYEAAIPLRAFMHPALVPADTAKALGISIVYKEMPSAQSDNPPASQGGGDNGFGGMNNPMNGTALNGAPPMSGGGNHKSEDLEPQEETVYARFRLELH